MAEPAPSTAAAVWESTLEHRDELIHNLNQNQNPVVEQRLAAVEERLLGLAAPDLEGVALKLELLWQAELHGEDQDSQRKLAILNDLRRPNAA